MYADMPVAGKKDRALTPAGERNSLDGVGVWGQKLERGGKDQRKEAGEKEE